jgi:hypothetical protein
MGRTLPTISQQLTETEAMLARFRRMLRKEDQYVLDGLFAQARLHIAAIGQTESLLPFEAALLAMLLEQAKKNQHLEHEIAMLHQRLEE